MAANVIVVTDKCYISAQKIHSVAVEENVHRFREVLKVNDKTKKVSEGSKRDAHDIVYEISIQFFDGKEDRHMQCRLANEADAKRVYKEIIEQIREQCPDKALMDGLVDKYVLGEAND